MSYPRSPARWLGPLALVAALAAVLAIVTASTGTEEPGSRSTSRSQEQGAGGSERRERPGEDTGRTSTGAGGTETAPKRKTYRVKPGDTLAGIAEETGVPIEEIERLNPDIDSSSLSIGQEIRLAR